MQGQEEGDSGGKGVFWQISWLDPSYNTDLLVQHTARHLNSSACKRDLIYSTLKKLGYWSWFYSRSEQIIHEQAPQQMNSGSFQHSREGGAIVMFHSGKEWMQKDQEAANQFSPRPIITSARKQIWTHMSIWVCVKQLQGPTKAKRKDCKDESISIYRELDHKDLASIKVSLFCFLGLGCQTCKRHK